MIDCDCVNALLFPIFVRLFIQCHSVQVSVILSPSALRHQSHIPNIFSPPYLLTYLYVAPPQCS